MSNEIKLKRCPYCGDSVEASVFLANHLKYTDTGWAFIRCMTCGARGPRVKFETEKGTLDDWETRETNEDYRYAAMKAAALWNGARS